MPPILPTLGLISPRHWQSFASRLPQSSLSKLARKRADDGEGDDSPESAPWWTREDLYGAPLPAPSVTANGTAIIPVKGVITSGLHPIYRVIGYADTHEIAAWVRAAAANPDVKKIVLSIDSPGGMVTGTPELGMEVDAAARIKTVIAHTHGMMDSAAYWIGSQAHEVWCTPSADVGCIGVYQMHYDFTGWLEDMGVKATIFKSGDLKATGHADIHMTEAQAEDIQKTVDLIGVQFRAAVTAKRTMVEPDSMRGQSFLGTEAASRGLVAGLRSLDSLL